jgi:hypothetical protein
MYEIGRFLAEVTGASALTAKTGTDQILIEFRFLEGPNNGNRISEYLALTDAALPYTVKKLRACGLPEDDLTRLDAMKGTEVELTLKNDTKQDGRTFARVAFIDRPRSQSVGDSNSAKAIAEKWKAKIAALPKEVEPPDPFGG